MLIDISDVLQINVFVLGGIFLQMCHLLRLEEHSMFSRCSCYALHAFSSRIAMNCKGQTMQLLHQSQKTYNAVSTDVAFVSRCSILRADLSA